MIRKYMLLSCLLLLLLGAVLVPITQVEAAVGTVNPAIGTPGTTFTFYVAGYAAQEQVGYWITDPHGKRYDQQARLFADGNGQVVWTWTAPTDAAGGTWEMTLEGYRLHSPTVTVQFSIDAPAVPPSAVSSYMILPDTHGPPGTTFTFVSRGGFEPNEQVGTWIVQPDGSELRLETDISSDGNGQIYRVWQSPTNARGGDWFFVARGHNSRYSIRIPFHIDNPADMVENPANNQANPTEVVAAIDPPTQQVTPDRGPRGTVFTFTAQGFAPGERVGTWVVRPDGTVVESFPDAYLYAANNATGDVSWSWTAPMHEQTGRWVMVIRGITSRVEWEIPFYVVDTAVTPTPVTHPTLTVSPASVPRGRELQFTASGYKPGERIFYWAINPTGDPVANEKELEADQNGAVTWKWEVESDWPAGTWTMYTRGAAGLQEARVFFEVSGFEAFDIRMQPASGAPGTTFEFQATGFYADEEMDFWLTTPESRSRRFDQEVDLTEEKLHADANGMISWRWTAPANVQAGRWHMTARGEESRVERVIAFDIVRATPLPDPYSVTPRSGPPGTTFTFSISDMPTSRAAYWVTAPDGTIYPPEGVDRRSWRVAVDDNGNATWNWTVPADAQSGTWLMVVRNLSDNLKLRPPKDREDIPRYEEDVKEYEEDVRDQAEEYREYVIRFTVE
jgi:hypothetical protein